MLGKLVSINITTYNRAHLLSRCLDSIIKQTYKNIEIVIVDDCSTDSTENLVKAYQEKYNFIKYFKHERNKGNAFSRNTAIKKCNGYYVAFMDDDDEWIDIDKIAKQLAIFESSDENLGIVCTGILRRQADGYESIEKAIKPKNLKSRILMGGLIHNSTVLTKKNLLLELQGFNLDLPRGIDYEFFIRTVLKHNYNVYFLPDITTKYYEDSPNRMTKKDDNYKAVKNNMFLQCYILKRYAKHYIVSPKSFINRLSKIFKLQLKLVILGNKLLRNIIYKSQS